jgi:hypothetical protein
VIKNSTKSKLRIAEQTFNILLGIPVNVNRKRKVSVAAFLWTDFYSTVCFRQSQVCEISGFCCGVFKAFALLGCYMA